MKTDGELVAWEESGRLCHGDGATSEVPTAGGVDLAYPLSTIIEA